MRKIAFLIILVASFSAFLFGYTANEVRAAEVVFQQTAGAWTLGLTYNEPREDSVYESGDQIIFSGDAWTSICGNTNAMYEVRFDITNAPPPPTPYEYEETVECSDRQFCEFPGLEGYENFCANPSNFTCAELAELGEREVNECRLTCIEQKEQVLTSGKAADMGYVVKGTGGGGTHEYEVSRTFPELWDDGTPIEDTVLYARAFFTATCRSGACKDSSQIIILSQRIQRRAEATFVIEPNTITIDEGETTLDAGGNFNAYYDPDGDGPILRKKVNIDGESHPEGQTRWFSNSHNEEGALIGEIASVTRAGAKMRGLARGVAEIRAEYVRGGEGSSSATLTAFASLIVNEEDPEPEVRVRPTTQTRSIDVVHRFRPTYINVDGSERPLNAKEIIWEVSDESIIEYRLLGDMNADGRITSTDALFGIKLVAPFNIDGSFSNGVPTLDEDELALLNTSLSVFQLETLDVTDDAQVDMDDITKIAFGAVVGPGDHDKLWQGILVVRGRIGGTLDATATTRDVNELVEGLSDSGRLIVTAPSEPLIEYPLGDKIIVDFNHDNATLVSEWINSFVEVYPNADNAGWDPADVDDITAFISSRFDGRVGLPLLRLVEDYHEFNSNFDFVPSLNGIQQVGDFNVTVVVGGDLRGFAETVEYTIALNEVSPATGAPASSLPLVGPFTIDPVSDGEIQFIDVAGGESGNPPIRFNGNIVGGVANSRIEAVLERTGGAGISPISGIILDCVPASGCDIDDVPPPSTLCTDSSANNQGSPLPCTYDPAPGSCFDIQIVENESTILKFITPNILTGHTKLEVIPATGFSDKVLFWHTPSFGESVEFESEVRGSSNYDENEITVKVAPGTETGRNTITINADKKQGGQSLPTGDCPTSINIPVEIVDIGDIVEF